MSGSTFFVTSLYSVVAWSAQLALFLSDPTRTALSATSEQAFVILTAVTAVVTTLAYAAWEAEYGTAFSYFVPLHGTARVDERAWRIGVFVRTNFAAALTLLVLVLLFTRAYPSLTLSGTPLLTPISALELLLFAIAQSFAAAALLVYAVAGQFYVVCTTVPHGKEATR